MVALFLDLAKRFRNAFPRWQDRAVIYFIAALVTGLCLGAARSC